MQIENDNILECKILILVGCLNWC